jgi:predicted ATPase
MLLALGQALFATKGYAAPAAGDAFARASALAERLNRSDYTVPLLYGQHLFHHIRSELSLAVSLAQQMEQIGEAQNDAAARLLGHSRHGIARFRMGEFSFARALFERSDGLKDPTLRTICAASTPTDQYDVMLAYLAFTLTILGYVNQGRSRLHEGLRDARERGHAHTLALVLLWAAKVEFAICSPNTARQYAEEVLSISKEYGFSLWLGWANTDEGEALTALGRPQEGLTLIADGLAMCRATEATLFSPSILSALAEAHHKLEQPIEGLNCLGEAVQVVETTGERWSEASVYRVRGDLLRAIGEDVAGEKSYYKAIAVAQRQSARLFELRAATSLARLYQDQGKCVEARDLLAPIYGWFTEGFDTPVLQEAKALLDELA